MNLQLHNPDGLPVEDAVDESTKLLLWQRGISPSEAAGRIFRVLYRDTAGKGGTLTFEPASKLMQLAEVNTESAQRVAVTKLQKLGLLEKVPSHRGSLTLRFLCASLPPVPQQMLPLAGISAAAPELEAVADEEDPSATTLRNVVAQAQCYCATPHTEEHPVSGETYVSTLQQPEQTGPSRKVGSLSQLCIPSIDAVLKALSREAAIWKLLGLPDKPGPSHYWSLNWALLEALYVLSEAEISGAVANVANKVREKTIKKTPGAALQFEIKKILSSKSRDAFARVGLLDEEGRPRQSLTFPEMKGILKHYGVKWLARWDQKPPPTRARSPP